jgi:hypothetical protein
MISPDTIIEVPALAYEVASTGSLGCICMYRKKINVSTVLAGQRLGIKEVDDGI